MKLSNVGKKFVYTSIIMMFLSMVLPWESLSDYTYSESMGLLMNIIPAVIFAVSALLVILKPLASALSRFGTNYIFLLLCLLNAIVLYFGMQYYPDNIASQNKELLHSTNIGVKRCNLCQTYLKQMQEVLILLIKH